MQNKNPNQTLQTGPSLKMLRRLVFLMAVFGIAVFALLLARLYKLQIIDHKYYEELAIAQQLRSAPSSVNRGTVYDCNMNVLAMSASVDNIYLSPAEIELYKEDRELIAANLAEILGLDYGDILKKTEQTGSWYVTVARKVEKEQADRVRRFKTANGLRGVRLETDTKRYYPNSSLACHLIGFVGTDNSGLEGIEAKYDSALSGTAGRTVRSTNAIGTDLLFGQFEEYYPGEDGLDVVMTIDSTIQYYVEKHLRQAVADYDIQNGAGAIAMDVNTGRILAMASLDGYDLNAFLDVSEQARSFADAADNEDERLQRLADAQIKQWRNKALSDTYEPGSTFKIITLAMALETGAADLSDSFYCGGNVNVLGRTQPIRCWKTQGHGSQTLTQAVQHSCNVAFVNIGQRVGAKSFYEYCEAFGFLRLTGNADDNLSAVTGIDLSGESGSIWWSENTFYNEKNLSQLAAASFGQTFTITPLQLITAVSACVNGGYLMKPYVVDSMLAADGTVAYKRESEVVRQVISHDTSEKLRSILEQVVGDNKEGTGRNAAVSGYRIGGKTGTSEKVSLEAATGEKEYIVSFVGFAPADEPQIAILVFLDTPSNKSGIYISGGQMAAPVVGKMLADILPYMGVAALPGSEDADTVMPRVVGKNEDEAREALSKAGLRLRVIGDGGKVTGQLPAPASVIAAGSEVILYLGAQASTELETVPDLSSMSYEQARDALSFYGIYIHTISRNAGPGQQIVSQSLQPGTRVGHGSIISVALISTDEELLGRY